MGRFTFSQDPVSIEPTIDIVLQRLPLIDGDRERFRLHRTVTYTVGTDEPGGPFEYKVPPSSDAFDTDGASVPQFLTWLVPKSGRHLPAALIHDALVGDPGIDRFEADRRFRDAMGDLDVGFIRRWLMWTAVSIETVRKRGTTGLRVGAIVTAVLVLVLGTLATINLFSGRTWVPWMGDRHWAAEIGLGLAGAVIVPMMLGLLLWSPIRVAGLIAGVAAAVLFHAVIVTTAVYGLYTLLERLSRRTQVVVAAVVTLGSAAAFAYGVVTVLA